MSGFDFLDTNILVYAYDSSTPEKQKIAQSILMQAVNNENAFVSTQVLGEFFTVITHKVKNSLGKNEALDIIRCLKFARILEVDYPMVIKGIEICRRYSISYWDSLIISAAERAGCKRLLSEDLNDGQKYNSVVVHNPFLKADNTNK